jgi:hypothetical protein
MEVMMEECQDEDSDDEEEDDENPSLSQIE